jgi:transposase-like protein
MPRQSREVWKKRVERWVDSGLTAQEFAAEIGVNASTLAHWKWQLAQGARGVAPGVATTPAGAGFVEVVTPMMGRASASERSAPEPLEVVLPGGVVVRVPLRFDAASLRLVVDTLGTR